MAYSDYIHCKECDCKVVYYIGDEDIEVLCTACLKQKQDTIDQLMKTNVFLSNLLSKQSKVIQKFNVEITKVEPVLPKVEVWVDDKLIYTYIGNDAIEVELGKIPLPHGAKLKIIDY